MSRAGQLGQLSTGVNDTLAGQHVSEADAFDFESRRGERDVRRPSSGLGVRVRSLSPMTTALSLAETRRLSVLLERMLALHPGPFHPVAA